MTPTLRTAWIAALRSGEYKQTTAFFQRTDGGYCCLGVLCVVGGQPPILRHAGNWTYVESVIDDPSKVGRLTCLNDVERKTFPEIADWIEANIPETHDDIKDTLR